MLRFTGRVNSVTVKVSKGAKPNFGLKFRQTSTNTKSGKGKLLFGLTATSVASLGGIVAYANYDPKFRSRILDSVPLSKHLFDYFLGSPSEPINKTPEISRPRPLPVKEPPKVVKEKEIKQKSVQEKPKTKPEVAEKNIEPQKETPVSETTTQTKLQRMMENEDLVLQQRLTIQETEAAAENAALSQILEEMIEKLSSVGNEAVLAHQASISSLKNYMEKIEQSIDSPKHAKDAAALAVSSAQANKNEVLKRATAKTNEAKQVMEKIKTAIARGRKSKITVANASLLSSEETINNMMYKLQSIDAQVEMAKSDAKVISEYRDMVEKAQREFQFELKKLLPDSKRGDNGRPLSSDELNEVVGHAHKRVDQLMKQLALHQATEKHRFQQALERQKNEHDRNSENKMSIEISKLQRGMDLKLEEKIAELREDFEQELRMQLRRQAAVHSDHLQDVLQLQQSELQLEFNKELEDKLTTARHEFESNLSRSYARLNGIEEGIKARADLNKSARMSQNLWLACQSLQNAVKKGAPNAKTWEDQLKPLSVEVQAVKETSHGTQSRLVAILDALPETALQRGIYPENTLKERFLHVYAACRRVAMIEDRDSSSLWRFALSYLQSVLLVDAQSTLSAIELAHKPIDPKKLTAIDVLSRARWCVERDDLELALRYMNLLKGAPRIVAVDWMNEVRMLLEVRQVADVLTALSSARGIQAIM